MKLRRTQQTMSEFVKSTIGRGSKDCDNEPKKKKKKGEKRKIVEPCVETKKPDCAPDECSVDPCKPQPRVVIIGAGLAALAAAHRLATCGITNFTVLEANNRPGGRIHSCWMGSEVAELGAMWLEGGNLGNPVYSLAAKEDLVEALPCFKPMTHLTYLTSDGRAIDPYISKSGYRIFQQIKDQAYALFSMEPVKGRGSLGKFLALRVQDELSRLPEERRYDTSRVLYGLINNLRARWGTELDQMSSDQYGSFIEVPGESISLTHGLATILCGLTPILPKGSIVYRKPVEKVLWCGQKDRAVVKCCDGEELSADYVLVTVSLGVLKSFADDFFDPKLPDEKLEAIRKIGFGQVERVMLQYNSGFWAKGEGTVKLAWDQMELADTRHWDRGVASIEERSDKVLALTIGGSPAVMMGNETDDELAYKLTKLLRKFTGDSVLPYPSGILRSRWCSDPYFLGSVSYMSLTSGVRDQCQLATPVPGPSQPAAPVLMFAGEATSPGHFGSLQGAYVSGLREADRIIKLTIRYNGPPPKLLD